jgi:hypothetical protein
VPTPKKVAGHLLAVIPIVAFPLPFAMGPAGLATFWGFEVSEDVALGIVLAPSLLGGYLLGSSWFGRLAARRLLVVLLAAMVFPLTRLLFLFEGSGPFFGPQIALCLLSCALLLPRRATKGRAP